MKQFYLHDSNNTLGEKRKINVRKKHTNRKKEEEKGRGKEQPETVG